MRQAIRRQTWPLCDPVSVLVVVGRFIGVGEAEAARSALDAAGISCQVADENMVAIDWLYSNAIGGVKVVVMEEDRDAALEVLRTIAEEAPPEASVDASFEEEELAPPSPDDSRCPACSATEIERVPRLRLFAAIALIGVGIGAAVGEPTLALTLIVAAALIAANVLPLRCTRCGNRWQGSPPRAHPESEAPMPDVADLEEPRCRQCGSREVHRTPFRRFKALPLLPIMPSWLLLPVAVLLPRWKCDQCGCRTWLEPRCE